MKFKDFTLITKYEAICTIHFDFSTDNKYDEKREALLSIIERENNKLLQKKYDRSEYRYQDSYYVLITQKSRNEVERLLGLDEDIDLNYIKSKDLYKQNPDLCNFVIFLIASI